MDGASAAGSSQPERKSLSAWRQQRGSTAILSEAVNTGRPPERQQRAKRPGSVDGPGRGPPSPATVPLAKQLKDVLDFLQSQEVPRPLEEIAAEPRLAGYDFTLGGPLQQLLYSSERVEVQAEGLVYKSEHGIQNQQDLLQWVRRHPSGTRITHIRDAYRSVLDDVQAAVKEGTMYKLFNYDLQCDVLFPVDLDLVRSMAMDADVLALYRETEVPSDPTKLVDALTQMRLPSRLALVDRKAVKLEAGDKQARKKQRTFNPTKATNVHLPELLASSTANRSIDVLPGNR